MQNEKPSKKRPSVIEISQEAIRHIDLMHPPLAGKERLAAHHLWVGILAANTMCTDFGLQDMVNKYVEAWSDISDPTLRLKLFAEQWEVASATIQMHLTKAITASNDCTDLAECIGKLPKKAGKWVGEGPPPKDWKDSLGDRGSFPNKN